MSKDPRNIAFGLLWIWAALTATVAPLLLAPATLTAQTATAQPAPADPPPANPVAQPAPEKPADPATPGDAADTAAEGEGGENPSLPAGAYEAAFRALFALFVIAVVLESGLALIFNWRPFIEYFDARGVKTLISFAFAYTFVEVFNMDLVTSLVNIYQEEDFSERTAGKVVTALILAGGSAGVNNMMVNLGFRSVRRHEEVVPRPEQRKAWLAVRLKRKSSKGTVMVLLKEGEWSKEDPGAIIGTIDRESKGNRWLRYFIRDHGKFPSAGGFPVKLETEYSVSLKGRNADTGEEFYCAKPWGPHSFEDRAIVDITLEL